MRNIENNFRDILSRVKKESPVLADALIEALEIINNQHLDMDVNYTPLPSTANSKYGQAPADDEIPPNARQKNGLLNVFGAPSNTPFGGGPVNTPNSFADLGTPAGMPYY